MKTKHASPNSEKNIPPLSTVLLFLAALLSTAAWRMSEVEQRADHPSTNVRSYQAQRHHGVPVDGGDGTSKSGEQRQVEGDRCDLVTPPNTPGHAKAWN